MKKPTVGVIFGGKSGEHEVSLKSAEYIIREMDRAKYHVKPIGISKTGNWITDGNPLRILSEKQINEVKSESIASDNSFLPDMNELQAIDIAFPVLHGPFGEDGTIQGFFEIAGIPYVGCGVTASAVAMDKVLFKDILRSRNIPSPKYVPILRQDIIRNLPSVIKTIENELSYPIFSKPVNLGSSVGITRCENSVELREGLTIASEYDRQVIAEQAVHNAREIEVSVLGNDQPKISLPGEIIPSRSFYSYEAKYIDSSDNASKLIIPANLTDSQISQITQLATRSFQAINGSGMSRVDFLINDDSGEIFLNEINTIPGFTEISMYPKLWLASGLPIKNLLNYLLDLAMERHAEKQQIRTSYNQ